MRTARTVTVLAVLATLGATAAVPATAAVVGHNKRVHEVVRLNDPLATANDQFGHQVAMDAAGSEVLVGAYLSNTGNGMAYLYKSKNGKWSTKPAAKFADPVAGIHHFGFSVALSPNGKTAYVGADQATIGGRAGAGAVYGYRFAHNAWPKKPSFVISDPGTGTNDYFSIGLAVSSDGDTLVVGAPGVTMNTVAEVGATYVYTASHGKLPATPSATIPSPTSSARGDFGYNVRVSSNANAKGTIVVGAFTTSAGSVFGVGAAYIFDSKGLHSWKLAKGGSLLDPAKAGDDFFGGVVTIDGAGTVVMVGAQDETEKSASDAGAVFTYVLKSGHWKASQTLDGPANGAANFGYPSISSNGKVAVTGAPNEPVHGHSYSGEAFVYASSGTSYALGASILDPTGGESGSPGSPDYFGNVSAESSTGSMSVIAAPATPGSGGNPGPGAVYVYSIS